MKFILKRRDNFFFVLDNEKLGVCTDFVCFILGFMPCAVKLEIQKKKPENLTGWVSGFFNGDDVCVRGRGFVICSSERRFLIENDLQSFWVKISPL